MRTGTFDGGFSLTFVRHQPSHRRGAPWYVKVASWLLGGLGNPALQLYTPDPANPLTYTGPDGWKVVLDEPFLTDGATTPRRFWCVRNLAPGDWLQAALVHDYLFDRHHQGRDIASFEEANARLEEMCRALGVSRAKARAIKRCCQMFGRGVWNHHADVVTGGADYRRPVAALTPAQQASLDDTGEYIAADTRT